MVLVSLRVALTVLLYRREKHNTLLMHQYSSSYHPSISSPALLKLGGMTGIPLLSAFTVESLASSDLTSSSVSTLLLTRLYAARLGLSTTSKNFCRRASDQEERSVEGEDALPVRMCARMGARESASAMPDARPRPA